MSKKLSKIEKQIPKKTKIEIDDNNLEMEPTAKRARIEVVAKNSNNKKKESAQVKRKKSICEDQKCEEVKTGPRMLRSMTRQQAKENAVNISTENPSDTKVLNNIPLTPTTSEEIDSIIQQTTDSKNEIIKAKLQLNTNRMQNTDNPQSDEVFVISSEIKPLNDLNNDTSCEIIETKQMKNFKKEEKPSKKPKKEDPENNERPFGMLPIRHIDELFGDLPARMLNELNEELDYHSTIVIVDEPIDHQPPTIVIDDEVSDDDDCVIVTYKCDLCLKSLKSEQSLKDHKKTHNFSCTLCNKRFSKERQLRRHKRFRHENPIKYSCRICGKKFNRPMSVTMHEKEIHATNREKANKCPTCGYECDSDKKFRKHQKTHGGEDKKIKTDKKPKIEVKDEKKVFTLKAVKNEN